MAESKNDKKPKSQGSFADDLDSMLNLDETNEQQVGLIDDDEAIDRLLVGDVFPEEDENAESGGLNDIDQLLAEQVGKDQSLAAEYDEFGDDVDDIIAEINITPKPKNEPDADEISPFDQVDEDEHVDLSPLESVEEIDEFADTAPAFPDFKADPVPLKDELENMAEIDEFSDVPGQFNRDNADFLLADFDISADDHIDSAAKSAITADLEAKVESLDADLAIHASERDIEAEHDDFAADIGEPLAETPKTVDLSGIDTAQADGAVRTMPEKSGAIIDHGAELAGLSRQINDLKKQQTLVKQEIQLKSNKDELNACLDSIDMLKTEQKKAKRNFDALANKKPLSAYVANAIAGVALIVGGGLGFQGYIAKLQVSQLVEHIGKLQEQISSAPAADAAETEMLRKQLDELTLANTVTANQLADLTKSLQGGGDTGKPAGDLAKHLSDLSNQDMQMGAAIEALQSKLAALEKGKVGSAPKPAVQKPPAVQENWIVNLVAFKQDWYAKRKAEEFTAKGVPARVDKAVTKGETWYRLVVDGFKTQYEAAAYAARVKKTLNLDSVWVAKIKN
ncbi:SPOR domain-containing protein [Methylomonas sp. LL1]|uniref:SPOR domain-containing protein n=1 Tax=Methylomonas sp. LL1 TaxID=2785785 RepID=UPI0018C4373C|nr:SPOR domain-containing protein [Methylomonas sp. LL1]QPK63727.1 SPOR domain-containing protein [Methylomonas sp. LL1]